MLGKRIPLALQNDKGMEEPDHDPTRRSTQQAVVIAYPATGYYSSALPGVLDQGVIDGFTRGLQQQPLNVVITGPEKNVPPISTRPLKTRRVLSTA